MSLRGRLLLGLGLVAVVLVAVGAVIARTTRADLMNKVDEQLLAVSRPFDRPGRDRGPRPGWGPEGVDVHGNDVNPSTVWVGGPDPTDVTQVVLEVADDGPGMAPELAARAFERFARGDVARSRRAAAPASACRSSRPSSPPTAAPWLSARPRATAPPSPSTSLGWIPASRREPGPVGTPAQARRLDHRTTCGDTLSGGRGAGVVCWMPPASETRHDRHRHRPPR